MSEPIVVGTDGSPAAGRAVEWAAAEAARYGRGLRIVHAGDRRHGLPAGLPPETAEAISPRGREILDGAARAARAARPDLEVTTELVPEPPVRALREESARAFEVVVGHRGLGGFTGLLLGSTGLGVADRAEGPVVVVRGGLGDGAGAGAGVGAGPARNEVVAGIDLTEFSAVVLEYAFEAAARRSARLRIVHAAPVIETIIEAGHAAAAAETDEVVRETVAEFATPWREWHPGLELVEAVPLVHPVQALVDASREAVLLVTGAHERAPRRSARVGSVAHGVIHHAACPVAIVHPRG
ncbi:universal stress protein [Actinomadura viridis]|uniref:Nucleotide-binding universal stress UspA family protein n=1 Tax=Actinomadura viridis TaxID=58110 RepID=A0A931GJF9_9ACTN|nr:universal stress protein [Actinomadura viridis]MBG6089195.1 nucleotide-binding universal stress UspA family protein [Actinomadura viridis]